MAVKVLYIEARKKAESREKLSIDFSSLPKRLFLAYSIQYKNHAEALKKELGLHGISVAGFQQVLGCTKLSRGLLKESAPILLVGSGKFHALNLALQSDSPILIYSPESSSISGIDEKELKKLKQKKKAAFSLFLNAQKIGIIVSLKPGQENLRLAEELKKKILKKYPEKKAFIFISNEVNLSELENFKIGFFINTACPGLFYDSPKIANADDIMPFL